MKKGRNDLEAKAFMFLLRLEEEPEKKYTDFETTSLKYVYVFPNNEKFKQYFVENGVDDISDDVLSLCKIKTTKKGSVIAMKKLCDRTICSYVEPDRIKQEKVKVYKK